MADTPITLETKFSQQTYETPDKWDVTWADQIKIPTNAALNCAQAVKCMTETARAIEWFGEKIALLTHLLTTSEDAYKEEWSKAFLMRSKQNAANQKKVEADADPIYMRKKSTYNKLKSYMEYFKQKQSGFVTIHHAMKEIVKLSHNEFGVANWQTTQEVYPEQKPDAPSEEGENNLENFDI